MDTPYLFNRMVAMFLYADNVVMLFHHDQAYKELWTSYLCCGTFSSLEVILSWTKFGCNKKNSKQEGI